MNLTSQIRTEHTNENSTHIADYIGCNNDRFDELLQIIRANDPLLVQRSSWILSKVFDRCPELIIENIDQIIEFTGSIDSHHALRRNAYRIIRGLKHIPEDYHGLLWEACFNNIKNQKEEIAIRAHSMEILRKLALRYPELVHEVKFHMAFMLDHDSPALRSQAKRWDKFMKKLERN